MSRSALPYLAGALAAIVLGLTSGWLLLHSPAINGTSRAPHYRCVTPYDSVVNGAANTRAGRWSDARQIELRCDDVDKIHFELGATAGVLAVVVAGITLVAGIRRARD